MALILTFFVSFFQDSKVYCWVDEGRKKVKKIMNEKEGEKDDEWERRWERWWMRKKVEEWMKKNNTRANFRRITNLYLLAQFNWSLQSQQNLQTELTVVIHYTVTRIINIYSLSFQITFMFGWQQIELVQKLFAKFFKF